MPVQRKVLLVPAAGGAIDISQAKGLERIGSFGTAADDAADE
jgi:hypothetical protein